ncbi:MAG: FtsX-like permease family protein [Marinifilaceae bacterium]
MLFNQIRKNKKWYGINTLGIGLAFAVTLIIFSFVRNEFSYDGFHRNASDIYRINLDLQSMKQQPTSSRLPGMLTQPLYDKFPEIRNVVRLIPTENAILTANENKYSSDKLFFTNKSFFEVFDFKVLRGNKETLFEAPNQVAISKKTALTFFGSIDVLGQEIQIQEQYHRSQATIYTVQAVLDDFPQNSHIKADLLFSLNSKEEKVHFPGFTYLLLEKGSKATSLTSLIDAQWKNGIKEGEPVPSAHLMPLKDIHLHSNNDEELSKNGSITSLIILITGALIVFLIAFINFTNLNYVQFITDLKNFKVHVVNGASRIDIAKILIRRSLLQISLAIVVGAAIAFNFNHFSKLLLKLPINLYELLTVSLLFYLIFASASLLPLITIRITKDLSRSQNQGSKKFVASLLFQFMLSIAAIITTIVLHKQMDFINQQHPGTEKSAIILIPNVPYPMIAKYEILKESYLKHPEIRNFSASTYKPGLIAPLIFPVEMEGLDSPEKKKLTILSIDEDFFKLFDIKALAGSLDMGVTSSVKWEQKAIGIHDQNPYKNQLLEELHQYTKEHGGFKEKYILNKAALKELGIKRPEDAIGKQFKVNFTAYEMFPKGEVIAVIDDLHYGDMFTQEKPLVLAAKKLFNSTFIAKIDPNQKAEAIKILEQEWNKIDPDHPFKYEFITDLYANIYANQYKEMRALTLFSILSIILSILGMFALSSFSIQHKTKEIGIRKANGSSSLEILFQLIREYTQWVIIAFAIASPIAYYITTDWLSKFAYRTEVSWWIFVLSGIMALGIAILTVSWQTWKAASQNPVEALKYE